MSRFFFHPLLKEKEVIALLPEEARHLEVERVGLRHPVFLSNGKGQLFQGIYLGKREGKCWVEVGQKVEEEKRSFTLQIWQSILRAPSRIDWLIEKLTELGVSAMYFFPAKRSVATFISPQRIKRWEMIVRNACKQSGRLLFPEIRVMRSWDEVLAHLRNSSGVILLADPSAPTSLWDILRQKREERAWSLIIGPEGDLTEEEKESLLFLSQIFSVRFLSTILRSETAALFGASNLASFLDGINANRY